MSGVVAIVGAEPAAFSCALELVKAGCSVTHLYPVPFGLFGASREIGLDYPEIGQPWDRLTHALGDEIACEFHRWAKSGIDDLCDHLPDLVRRGSRLSVTRTERETELLTSDAVSRSRPPLNDEVRLMSGGAVSNYAPVTGSHAGCFETHTASFAPVKALQSLAQKLSQHDLYSAHPIEDLDGWANLTISTDDRSVSVALPDGSSVEAQVCVLASGRDTVDFCGRFKDILVTVQGQAFRSTPLRETTRSSVVGLSASWGYERYRFDEDYRLLGTGIDPTGGGGERNVVDVRTLERFLERAKQLFTDLNDSPEDLLKWAVEFTTTCDGLPLLGPVVGQPKIQVVEGFFYSAWSRGWEAGRRIAQAITASDQAPDSVLMDRCSPRRFTRQLKR